MKLITLSYRERILKEIYELAKLELSLEQAKDDLAEAYTDYSKNILTFRVEKLILDIKIKKFDVQYLQEELEKLNPK